MTVATVPICDSCWRLQEGEREAVRFNYQGDIWCTSVSSNNVITFFELY
jgi:hypothetical protein